MRPVVTVIGTMHMDFVIYVEDLPKPGETVIGYKFETFPGGKGANQAVALARLGSTVYLISRVGDDFIGKALLENAVKNNVRIDYVTVDKEEKSGVAFIIVDERGENVIAVAPGVDSKISVEDVENASSALRKSSLVLAQLEIPVKVSFEALKKAKQYGAITVLNVAPAKAIPIDDLKYVDIVILNQGELDKLVKILFGEALDYIAAARRILEHGPRLVVVTMGKRGATMVTRDYHKLIPTFDVKVVDTVGAGDAFCGGFAYALLMGAPYEEAVLFANMVASLKVTKKGAQTGLPYLAEVKKFAEEKHIEFSFL